MLTPLICKQCGGKLEVEDTKVLVSGESFIVLPNQNFECPHCGTKYVSDDTSKYIHASNGSVAIGSLSFGEVQGNIVIGSGVSHTPRDVAPSAKTAEPIKREGGGRTPREVTPASKTNKPAKKWWEFWK